MGRLYWSAVALPSARQTEETIARLRPYLDHAFPSADNQGYLNALMGKPQRPALPRVTAARLTALSLLPPLMERAGFDPSLLRLSRDEHGRPYGEWVSGGGVPFDFNLSHSDSYAVCALLTGSGRVGVDAEDLLTPARALPLIGHFCTEGEQAAMQGLSDEDRAAAFTRMWTIREALSKQDGRGMPLRYDAVRIPDTVRVFCGVLAPSGTGVAVCVPDCVEMADIIAVPPCPLVEWAEVK